MKDKTTIIEWILGCCITVPTVIVLIIYVVLTWSFCLSTTWNWYMVPIFHYPPLTLMEAWVLIMILGLARPNMDGWKHEVDLGKMIGCFISPWFTLLILFILKNYIVIDQLQTIIIEKMK